MAQLVPAELKRFDYSNYTVSVQTPLALRLLGSTSRVLYVRRHFRLSSQTPDEAAIGASELVRRSWILI